MSDRIVTFQEEKWSQIHLEMLELGKTHWDEVAFYKDIKLDPDLQGYFRLEKANAYALFTVRTNQKLIGYIGYAIGPHLHYKVLTATEDVHFLHPDYRNSTIGLKLLRYGEQKMVDLGVIILSARTKADPKVNHSAIFERLGYDKQDIVYTKRLDRGV